MTHDEINAKLAEAMGVPKCDKCGGDGWYEDVGYEHHPCCDGSCSLCPEPVQIQAQCHCVTGLARNLDYINSPADHDELRVWLWEKGYRVDFDTWPDIALVDLYPRDIPTPCYRDRVCSTSVMHDGTARDMLRAEREAICRAACEVVDKMKEADHE